MPRPRPESLAAALVVPRLIAQCRIPQRRQAIRRNELPLPRREPLPISAPPVVPLLRPTARLVDSGREHPLQISSRRRQRLLQINLLALVHRHWHQRPPFLHIHAGQPTALPIARLVQRLRSKFLGSLRRGLGRLHRRIFHSFSRIRALIFLLLILLFLSRLFVRGSRVRRGLILRLTRLGAALRIRLRIALRFWLRITLRCRLRITRIRSRTGLRIRLRAGLRTRFTLRPRTPARNRQKANHHTRAQQGDRTESSPPAVFCPQALTPCACFATLPTSF